MNMAMTPSSYVRPKWRTVVRKDCQNDAMA